MTVQEFKDSLKVTTAPGGLTAIQRALWFDGKGDWEAAHNIAQDIHSREGSLIHAYLHRKEGDEGNAGYWYARAGEKFPTVSLDQEWNSLVERFLI